MLQRKYIHWQALGAVPKGPTPTEACVPGPILDVAPCNLMLGKCPSGLFLWKISLFIDGTDLAMLLPQYHTLNEDCGRDSNSL